MAPATKTKFKIDVHDAAAIFPMISDAELMEMAKSITLHGLREKIQAIPQVEDDATHWLVIDGRNRLEALRRMGVSDEQIVSDYIEPINLASMNASPEEYIVMANIERRNLTAPQRKELAGKLAVMLAEQQKNLPKSEQTDTLQKAADAAGVSRRTAATAKATATGKKPAAKKPTPKKKKALLPTPATVLDNAKKGNAAAQKFGHNWPAQIALECFIAAVDLVETLAALETVSKDGPSKLGPKWNVYTFLSYEDKKKAAEALAAEKS